MDEDFEQRCQEIKESRKQRGKLFDTEDLKTCLGIFKWPCKTPFFALLHCKVQTALPLTSV